MRSGGQHQSQLVPPLSILLISHLQYNTSTCSSALFCTPVAIADPDELSRGILPCPISSTPPPQAPSGHSSHRRYQATDTYAFQSSGMESAGVDRRRSLVFPSQCWLKSSLNAWKGPRQLNTSTAITLPQVTGQHLPIPALTGETPL